ncbi:MAG: hypothetical protein DHS20C12_29030 [Pseudohongiella sp.]|nr:MAG: hypothetical protein DHS20C12_29030 [Pseudohongiella sp.]
MTNALFKKARKLLVTASILSLSLGLTGFSQAGEERRAPPETRQSGTLSDATIRAITQISEFLSPEDGSEPNLVRAKEELDELYERRYERMNDFEKSTLLNFYTNYYLTTENYPEAIRSFEQILTIEELRADVRDRALKSLGQLTAAEERWQDSIRYYDQWREVSEEEDDLVYKGLASAHYQVEEFTDALEHWINYMNFQQDDGVELVEADYRFLQGVYFILEDFPNALEVTRTMIMLFDNPQDWRNLPAIYATLEDDERRIRSLNLVYLRGFIDDENNYLSLGQSIAAIDAPYSGAKIFNAGEEAGFVEENEDNLFSKVQMYMLANLYDEALEPALKSAEMMESGDGWDTVGYIHYVLANYDDSVEAFETAIEKGNLSNPSDTHLYLARALLEVDEFDRATEAARTAADLGSERDRNTANTYIRAIASTQTRYNTIETRKQEAIDFYIAYPPP